MIPVCLYFQVHQPYRLRRYNYFDVGREHRYFDDTGNADLLRRASQKCYRPATEMLGRLLARHPRFAVSFSLSGCLLEQLRDWDPDTLGAFRRLADSGRVEFLAETSHHSLSWLASPAEFASQVDAHRARIAAELGQVPRVFRNTELIYSDALAAVAGGTRLRRGPGRRASGRCWASAPARHLYRAATTGRPAAPAARLPALRRHRVPLLAALLGRVAADRREIRPLGLRPLRGGPLALHGLRDLRRAPVAGDRDLRVLRGMGRPDPGAARRDVLDALPGDRAPAGSRNAVGAPRPLLGRRGSRPFGLAGQRPAARRAEAAVRAGEPRASVRLRGAPQRLPPPLDLRPLLLHGHQDLRGWRGTRLLLALRVRRTRRTSPTCTCSRISSAGCPVAAALPPRRRAPRRRFHAFEGRSGPPADLRRVGARAAVRGQRDRPSPHTRLRPLARGIALDAPRGLGRSRGAARRGSWATPRSAT